MKKSSYAPLFAVMLLAAIVVTAVMLRFCYPRKYSALVSDFSKRYGISENLVYAIIKCESGFDPSAKSEAGAVGLMQITPDTLSWAAMREGESDISDGMLYDAYTNIRYGCCIFSLLYGEFGDIETALAAYNAGRGKVLGWLADSRYSDDGVLLSDIPYGETLKYVKKVKTVKRIYELIY